MSEHKKNKVLKMSGLLPGHVPSQQGIQTSALGFFTESIPNEQASTGGDTLSPTLVPLSLIDGSPYQNRSTVSLQRIEALAKEVKRHGLNNPIIVRPRIGGRYELVAGENRVAAYRLNEETHIPAFVRPMDDGQSATTLVLDNFHHGDLSDYEIYKGLVILKKALQGKGLSGSLSELAELTPWGKSQVHRLMSFAKLPNSILELLDANPEALGSQAASDIAKLSESSIDENILLEAVRRIISGELEQGKATEWILAENKRALSSESEKEKPTGRGASRSIRAVTTNSGSLVCTIERTPKGLAIKGAKNVDWASLENDLADWLIAQLAN